MFLLFSFFRAPWSGRRFVPLFPELLLFPFYTSIYHSSNVHVQVQRSRADTCSISPYPKWLGVVVKTEKYCSVRCRVFNCSNGSLSFVLCRQIVQGSFLHQCGCVRLFPKLFLYHSRHFFHEHFEMPRTESSSAVSQGYLDFHCMSSVMPLLGSRLEP